MKLKSSLCVMCAAVLATMSTNTASAHHSVAAYDSANQVALSGTVKEFIWANPHCWFYLMVPNAQGGADEWQVEGNSVNGLARNGWTPDTLKPGMKVKLKIAPRRDGKPGGAFQSLLEIDGKPYQPQAR
jgi:hypothetical protein